ncbi:MAG: NHL repeat-containing protein [Betaproteobacteria bacterium]|nr:NHL repeat-containing protein [Betaproteobacteria bacterium]
MMLSTPHRPASIRFLLPALCLCLFVPPLPAQEAKTAITPRILAGDGTRGYRDGPGSTAQFQSPYGIVAAADGNLYVSDTLNHRIRRIDRDGKVSTFAGDGTAGFRDGPARRARFDAPSGLGIAPDGSLLVADTRNNRIRRITMDGKVSTVAGAGTIGLEDGAAAEALFDGPTGVAAAADGTIYVADTLNRSIRAIGTDGKLSTLAGERTPTPEFRDGASAEARFDTPIGIVYDAKEDVLYVADTHNHRIRRVSRKGVVSTVAGSTRGDSDGEDARFNTPYGIALGAGGTLYVTDSGNRSIRRIVPGEPVSRVSTVAGKNPARDAAGRAIRPDLPIGIATRDGSLYVVDSVGHQIIVFDGVEAPAAEPGR